jgi:thiol-disulfide isomerase/thioredoxin
MRPLARGDVAAVQVPKEPRPVPALAFTGPDGQPTSLAAFRGKTVLFNLWATWCAPCRHEMPALDRLQATLGGDAFQTFRYVTFPLMRSALLAGGLLAFGLSFDEIVVTTFTASPGLETLPLWIFNNLSRGDQQPIVTVVASTVMLLSIVPVWLAQRLTGEPGAVTGGTR